MKEEFIWVEKYRPKTIKDCILSKDLKSAFSRIVKIGELQNMIFAGKAGCGKTTVARALCEELELDYMFINGSLDAGIDTLRTTIKNFASTVSLTTQKYKCVILDEADYLNPTVQPALRGFMEEFSKNCRFILTCNFENRILDALKSRCAIFNFRTPNDEIITSSSSFYERIKKILDEEKVTYEKKVLVKLIQKSFPDFRKIINECQKVASQNNNTIDANILSSVKDIKVKELIVSLKSKKFNGIKSWILSNLDNDTSTLIRTIYDALYEHAKEESIPNAIITLADYQFKAMSVPDQEINMLACLIELAFNCEWR